MKRQIRKQRVVRESVGRDLVGASNFASRGSVVKQIVAKYPNPKQLAAALSKLASATGNPKAQAKLQELAAQCSACTPDSYPAFVKKVAGFSNLWGIVAKTAGAAGLVAAAMWTADAARRVDVDAADKQTYEKIGNRDYDVVDGSPMKNRAVTRWDLVKGRLGALGDVMKGDVTNAWNHVHDASSKAINDWRLRNTPAGRANKWFEDVNSKDIVGDAREFYPDAPTA